MCKNILTFMCKHVFLKRDVCQHCVARKPGKRPPFYAFLIQTIDRIWYLAICWQTSPPGPKLANVPPLKSGGPLSQPACQHSVQHATRKGTCASSQSYSNLMVFMKCASVLLARRHEHFINPYLSNEFSTSACQHNVQHVTQTGTLGLSTSYLNFMFLMTASVGCCTVAGKHDRPYLRDKSHLALIAGVGRLLNVYNCLCHTFSSTS